MKNLLLFRLNLPGARSVFCCNLFSFFLLFIPSFPQQGSAWAHQIAPTSQCSVYTPLNWYHHSYISCQVELASFSTSCCSAAKNKALLLLSCHEVPVWSSTGHTTSLSDKLTPLSRFTRKPYIHWSKPITEL